MTGTDRDASTRGVSERPQYERRIPWNAVPIGILLLVIFCLLEWLVLFARLPVDWSGGLGLLVLRNVALYALAGVPAGVALAILAGLLRLAPRLRTSSGPALAWAVGLAGITTFYWVHAVNVLYAGGAREPAALVLDALALVGGLALAVLLARSLTRSGRPVRIAIVSGIVIVSLWMPFYIMAADRIGERVTGGPNLGPVMTERAAEGPLPNVVLIMLDTTRTDCMGCYGASDSVTPSIDRFAAEGVLFEQAVTPEPLTRPTVSTVFTGMYPRTHGVDTNTRSLDGSFLTLAETLQANGYVTGAFMAATVLSGFYGTDQGFDSYTEPVEGTWELSPLLALQRFRASVLDPASRSVEIPADEVTRRASRWIRNNADRRFFAFVHYFDPHYPYEPPAEHDLARMEGLGDVPVPYTDPQDRFRDGFAMPDDFLEMMWLDYRGEIEFVDESVGKLLRVLDELGISDETLVVVFSDHGESFEKGFYFAHGNRLYDSLVHVALVARLPGRLKPGRVEAQVGLIDVYPTLCDLLGIPLATEVQGVSALPALPIVEPGADSARAADAIEALDARPVYLQTDFENPKPFSSRVSMGLRLRGWKYVESPELGLAELYDLNADPGELVNLADSDPSRAAGFGESVRAWFAGTERIGTGDVELSPERLEELRALGYVQ